MKLNIDGALKYTAVSLSCLTMVLSPVAMGQEAQNLTKASITAAVKDLGLHKKETVGQFWDKIKYDLPGTMYQDLESFVKENRNVAMPEVSIDSLKSTSGEDVPVVRLNQAGKTDTIQFFGEQNKFVTFNGVVLTARDVQRLRYASDKIEASDFNVRRNVIAYEQQQQQKQNRIDTARDFSRFTAFPRVTPAMWKSMTKEQRVGFIVSMRRMWQSAHSVLLATKPGQIPKAPKKAKKSAAVENFLQTIFGENAQAASVSQDDTYVGDEGALVTTRRNGQVAAAPVAPRALGAPRSLLPPPAPVARTLAVAPNDSSTPPPPPPPPTLLVPEPSSAAAAPLSAGATADDSSKCVVAGYIGVYTPHGANVNGNDRTVCNVQSALASPNYASGQALGFVTDANKQCADLNHNENSVACNPVVYGYTRGTSGGSPTPICIDKMTRPFQIATTNPGLCDTSSRLSATAFDVKYKASPEDRAKEIAQIESEQMSDDAQANYRLTREYLDSFLAVPAGARTTSTSLDQIMRGGVWTPEIDTELVTIQKNFESEIQSAMQICENSLAANPRQIDPNQKAACDQLHRRWLFTEKFVADFRQLGCKDGSKYTGAYDGAKTTDRPVASALNKSQYSSLSNEDQKVCQCNPSTPTPGSGTPPLPGSSAPPSSSSHKVKLNESCAGPTPPPAPPAPPTPPPAPPVTTCNLTGPHSADPCKCNDDYKENESHACEKDSGFPLWAKIGIGLVAVGGILCLTHTLICKKKKDPPVVTPPLTCADGQSTIGSACACGTAIVADCNTKGGALDANTCVCTTSCSAAIAADCSARGGSLNAAGCVCAPPNPPTCPAYQVASANNVCVCSASALAAACTGGQRPDAASCGCVPVDIPLCPGTTIPLSQGCPPVIITKCPDGVTVMGSAGISSCPKCSDGSYVISGQSCPVAPPTEGGTGTGNGGFGGVR